MGAFDEKISSHGSYNMPKDVMEASIWVTDTMDIARASAEQVFGESVNNETIIKVYDRICSKIYEQARN